MGLYTQALDEAAADPTALLTYEDLNVFFDQTEAPGLDQQQVRNRKSVLNQFLLHRGINNMTAVGQELGDEGFLHSLLSFQKGGEAEGLGKGTLDNRKTAMRQWSKTYKAMFEVQRSPKFDSFSDALRYYCDIALARGRIKNLSKAAIAVNLRVSYLTQAILYKRKNIVNKYLKNISELEVLLGAPTTSLTQFVGHVEKNISKINYGTGSVEWDFVMPSWVS